MKRKRKMEVSLRLIASEQYPSKARRVAAEASSRKARGKRSLRSARLYALLPRPSKNISPRRKSSHKSKRRVLSQRRP